MAMQTPWFHIEDLPPEVVDNLSDDIVQQLRDGVIEKIPEDAFDLLPDFISQGPVRRDGGDNGDDTISGKKFSDVADAANVFVPVRL